MKKLFIKFHLWFVPCVCMFLLLFLYISCDEIKDDEKKNLQELSTKDVTVGIELGDAELIPNFNIVTAAGERVMSAGETTVPFIENEKPQLALVTNEDGGIVLMSREVLTNKQQLVVNAHSTAIALVTLHPLFAPIVKDYNYLVQLVESNPHFQTLLAAVETSIAENEDLYAEDNYEMAVALSDLLNDLCEDPSEAIQTTRANGGTRASSINADTYPMEVTTSERTLTMRMTGLAPSYFGTVTAPNGDTKELSVITAADYSGWDFIKKGIDWVMDRDQPVNYGEPVILELSEDGNYKFSLSKNNMNGYADLCFQIVMNIFDMIGMPDWSDYLTAMKGEIGTYMTELLTGKQEFSWEDFSIMAMKIINEIVANQLEQQSKWKGDDFSKSMGNLFSFFSKAFNYYDKFSGAANAATRVAWFINAIDNIEFCLSAFGKAIHSCSEAYLDMVSGNEQEGEAMQALLLPLKVRVRMVDEQGKTIPNVYMKVKYTVTEGNGSVSSETVGTEDEASVYWTLGEGEPGDIQKVEAVIVDMITGEKLTEPVVFTAKLKKSSDITVRLDWHKLSGNTDIDLHVVDPYGVEIYYAHRYSGYSEGWLDRDDVVGPGPEHIYFEDAPAGSYKVKVHYYNSETKAVTSYRVTVTALGQTKTYSGSIAYHQEIPITTINIPASSGQTSLTRSNLLIFQQPTELPEWKIYPQKVTQTEW